MYLEKAVDVPGGSKDDWVHPVHQALLNLISALRKNDKLNKDKLFSRSGARKAGKQRHEEEQKLERTRNTDEEKKKEKNCS